MEYLVPLLIVLVVVLIVLAGARFVGRGKRQPGDGPAAPAGTPGNARMAIDITREDAERASARLDPEAHRRVYSLIAQHQVFNAVKEYRLATRTGLREASASVAALAQFPQPTPDRTAQRQGGANPAVTNPAGNGQPAAPESKAVSEGPLTVADILAAEQAQEPAQDISAPVAVPTNYRYRAIVSQGDDIREVASTRLNAQIFQSITDLALAGNYDGAATLLRGHADIGDREALEFVRMITPSE